MVDPNQPNEDSYEVPIHIIESTPEPDEIDDRYAIVCPVCGYEEFEDIVIRAKRRVRWSKKSIWEIGVFPRNIHSIRCLRCDYILNFARE